MLSCSLVASAVASRRAVNDSVRIWLRSSLAKGPDRKAHVCCRAAVAATADPSTGRWEPVLEHNTHPTIQAMRQLLDAYGVGVANVAHEAFALRLQGRVPHDGQNLRRLAETITFAFICSHDVVVDVRTVNTQTAYRVGITNAPRANALVTPLGALHAAQYW
jgi:hypothetical protein